MGRFRDALRRGAEASEGHRPADPLPGPDLWRDEDDAGFLERFPDVADVPGGVPEVEDGILNGNGGTTMADSRLRKMAVTGASGLIGSEAVLHFDALGVEVLGIDNNLRADFFGPKGDTGWNLERVKAQTSRFRHFSFDIRDRGQVLAF